MSQNNFMDQIQQAANQVSLEQIEKTNDELARQHEGRAWDMNTKLNMIAYDDQ